MIGIYKYRSSNYFSLVCALKKADIQFEVSDDFENLVKFKKIIIPGVGHIDNFFDKKKPKELKKLIDTYTQGGGLVYGICLGAQAFLDVSEESGDKTCSILTGKTVSLEKNFNKVMNVSFKNLLHNEKNIFFKKIFNGIEDKKFYFLHKYYCDIEEKNVEKVFFNFENQKLIAAFFGNGVIGTQFHPELSKNAGLKFLKNFEKI